MAQRELMSWGACLKEHIKKIPKDKERAKALLSMAKLRHEFLTVYEFNQKYSSIVAEGYYEIMKELLTALFYIEGYNSDNHECLISYLRQHYPDLVYEAGIIHQLKNIRNDIGYKGFIIDPDYLEKNKLEFKHIIKILEKLISDKLKK
ncbi:MAG: hypothetical protein AABW64_01260 [Nanoarchaeota archaeon]